VNHPASSVVKETISTGPKYTGVTTPQPPNVHTPISPLRPTGPGHDTSYSSPPGAKADHGAPGNSAPSGPVASDKVTEPAHVHAKGSDPKASMGGEVTKPVHGSASGGSPVNVSTNAKAPTGDKVTKPTNGSANSESAANVSNGSGPKAGAGHKTKASVSRPDAEVHDLLERLVTQ
jgi:hypothetical protein